MSVTKRFTILSILLLSFVFTLSAFAQDTESALPEDLAGSMIVSSETVSITADSEVEGAYELVLSGVDSSVLWVVTNPALNTGAFELVDFAGIWAAATEGTSAEAIFRLDVASVFLTLSNPVYDQEANTLTYTATDVEIAALDDSGSKELPSIEGTFENIKMFIKYDVPFATGFAEGIVARSEGARLTVNTGVCVPGVTCKND